MSDPELLAEVKKREWEANGLPVGRAGGLGEGGCRTTARSYRTNEKTAYELDGGENSQKQFEAGTKVESFYLVL